MSERAGSQTNEQAIDYHPYMAYNPHYFQLRAWQLERVLEVMRGNGDAEPGGVVFFGDSLTQNYPIDACFPELPVKYNCGIGGAVSEELLWVADEAVIRYHPKLVVLMVGTNDMAEVVMASPKEIACRVKDLIDLIRGNLPDTPVLLWSALPCVEALRSYHEVPGTRSNDFLRMVFAQECEIIRDPGVTMVDVFDHFVDESGEAIRAYYRDGLHINEQGYEVLTRYLAPEIHKLLGM